MKAIDLTKKLKGYKSGWVAFDKSYNVVAHASNFASITNKVKNKKNLEIVMPASENYFGFITSNG